MFGTVKGSKPQRGLTPLLPVNIIQSSDLFYLAKLRILQYQAQVIINPHQHGLFEV